MLSAADICQILSHMHTMTPRHTHAHTRTRTRTHTHTPLHTHTNTHMQTHTPTHSVTVEMSLLCTVCLLDKVARDSFQWEKKGTT